jgi:hypothetical protein
VRPFFGFELAQWTTDGERLIVKVVPSGASIAEANVREPRPTSDPARFPSVALSEAAVFVRRVDPGQTTADTAQAPDAPGTPARVIGDLRWAEVDLVEIDLTTRGVRTLVERTPVRAYALSPDEKQVAYVVHKGWEENT